MSICKAQMHIHNLCADLQTNTEWEIVLRPVLKQGERPGNMFERNVRGICPGGMSVSRKAQLGCNSMFEKLVLRSLRCQATGESRQNGYYTTDAKAEPVFI